MKIRFHKHTAAGRVPALDRMYRQHFERIAPDVEVEISTLPPAAYDGALPEGMVRYGAVEAFFATDFVRQAVAAERDGCDAYVIGTSQDPGLRDARAVVGIPVVGYGETAIHFAAMTGRRFGVVGFIPELATPIGDNIRAAGLEHRLVGFDHLEGGPDVINEAFAGDASRLLDQFEVAVRRLADRGAELIIPGEGLPNEILVDAGIHSLAGVPIVDADGLAVKLAILLVELRQLGILDPTSPGYWHATPPPAAVDHLADLFLKPPPTT